MGLGQLGLPIARNAGIGEQHLAAVGQAHDAQVQAARCAQVVALGQDLVDHGAAHVAHAQAENVQRLDFGFEERLVQGLQGLALVLGIDDDADVALGGALADGPDADAVAAEGAKGTAGDAALLAHAVSDKGHDGKSGFDDERSDAAQLLVSTKLFVQCLFGAVGIGISHSDGNGVFRGALRHQDHIDSGQRQGCKQPAGKAGYADHAPAADGDEGDVFEGAQSGHATVGKWGV